MALSKGRSAVLRKLAERGPSGRECGTDVTRRGSRQESWGLGAVLEGQGFTF